MDRKTGRPIISLKFKETTPAEADQPAAPNPRHLSQATGLWSRAADRMPKVASRKQGVREVVVTRPVLAPPPVVKKTQTKKAASRQTEAKPVEEARPVPIPPAAFKAATKAATVAVDAVLADPGWQSAELQQSYQDAKQPRAAPPPQAGQADQRHCAQARGAGSARGRDQEPCHACGLCRSVCEPDRQRRSRA